MHFGQLDQLIKDVSPSQGRRKGFGGGAAQTYPTCAAWSRGITA